MRERFILDHRSAPTPREAGEHVLEARPESPFDDRGKRRKWKRSFAALDLGDILGAEPRPLADHLQRQSFGLAKTAQPLAETFHLQFRGQASTASTRHGEATTHRQWLTLVMRPRVVVSSDEDALEDSLRIDSSARALARCRRCGKSWSPHLETCPDDGANLRHEGHHHQLTEVSSEDVVTEKRNLEPLGEHDDTTIEGDTNITRRAVGDATAVSRPFSGTPTSLAIAAKISSGEITAQTARAVESTLPPTAQPASDPTTATRLDPCFVHLVAGTFVGELVIEKLLGAGGMGAVYGATHERLGKRAAVKVISPALSTDHAAVERFEQEALALARLSHPNVVGVTGVGRLAGDGRSYFVMEWLEGRSLHDCIHDGPVDRDLALNILDQIARGLDAAHAAGIVHRDLKPDNCWLQRVGAEPTPIVKILDFGLAKLAEHRRSEETAIGTMFGTATYMSPEQCQSARDVGPPTDVYALGCISYELLVGRLPFVFDNVAELIVAHQTEEPPRPRQLAPHLDAELDEVLFSMLAKDPNQRPTLAQVRATLARSRRAWSAPHSVAPSVASTLPRSGRSLHAIVGAGVALFAVIVIAAVAARGRTEHPVASEQADAPEIDGGAMQRGVASPIVLPAPVVVHAPTIDAGTPPIDAGRGARTSRREGMATVPVDAALAVDVDAESPVSAPVDAGQPETPPVAPASEGKRVEPPAHRQTSPLENKVLPLPDKDRTTPERNPNRDQTFNPFRRKPR